MCCSKGAFDYCSNLGGVLASADFFDLYNIGESPRTTANMPNDTSSIDRESNQIEVEQRKKPFNNKTEKTFSLEVSAKYDNQQCKALY